MKQLSLFELDFLEDIPGDFDPERYGKGRGKIKQQYWDGDEDDPAYITPVLKNNSPKNNPVSKTSLGESKKQTGNPRTEPYTPHGTAKGENQYFHLKYKLPSGKWTERHICGGNISSPVAQRKKKAIDDAIAQGTPIDKLLEMCK